jgi:hypothetical protein
MAHQRQAGDGGEVVVELLDDEGAHSRGSDVGCAKPFAPYIVLTLINSTRIIDRIRTRRVKGFDSGNHGFRIQSALGSKGKDVKPYGRGDEAEQIAGRLMKGFS